MAVVLLVEQEGDLELGASAFGGLVFWPSGGHFGGSYGVEGLDCMLLLSFVGQSLIWRE